MRNKIESNIMELCDISQAINLWQKQAQYFSKGKAVYPFWENKNDRIEKYLKHAIKNENAFAAKQNERLVGFITCDIFEFHNSLSAICHDIGNAATIENRQQIYLSLYNALSKHCVSKGALAHYIGICHDDLETREILFNLGFGAYVVHAQTQFNKAMSFVSEYDIGAAITSDANEIFALYCESQQYLLSSPIFLKTPCCSLNRIEEMIKQNNIYVAKDNGKVIGIWDLEVAHEDIWYGLKSKGDALVCNEIGAYIKEEYRGKNIGIDFIKVVSDFCIENNIKCAHVPWETSNPYANKFWRKYFNPVTLALKRVIHPNVTV
jgi:hypothetical protein